MWNRLTGRGVAIALCIAVLLIVRPTAVPGRVAKAWNAAQSAARAGDALAAEQALGDLRPSPAWLTALKPDWIQLALANGNAEFALALLDSPPSVQAPQEMVECWRAEAHALLGDRGSAFSSLSSIDAGRCPAPLPLLKAIALRELDARGPAAAAAMLESLAAFYPADAEAASLTGACLVLEDAEAAQPLLLRAASLGDPLAVDLAAALRGLEEDEPAAAWAAFGEVFLRHSMWPFASESFRRLTDLEPRNASAHAYLGLALDQQGSDGLPELETAAGLDPGSAMIQMMIGLHWQQQGQPNRAIPFLERSVAIEPDNGAYRASLAAALAEVGDLQAAITGYQQAAELQPADPVYWRLLAAFSITQELELADTGLPAARNALALDPDDPPALDLAGYAHLLLGDIATAERLLTRALALDPSSASARLHYGLLLSHAGRAREAREQLAAAAALGGQTITGQRAQRALSQIGE